MYLWHNPGVSLKLKQRLKPLMFHFADAQVDELTERIGSCPGIDKLIKKGEFQFLDLVFDVLVPEVKITRVNQQLHKWSNPTNEMRITVKNQDHLTVLSATQFRAPSCCVSCDTGTMTEIHLPESQAHHLARFLRYKPKMFRLVLIMSVRLSFHDVTFHILVPGCLQCAGTVQADILSTSGKAVNSNSELAVAARASCTSFTTQCSTHAAALWAPFIILSMF
ncbi:uncharacterized protein [Nothobranchius furzeri]|uniref:uncharacterized protein n=1 Tax=Nothobranchius furzeri TaxID=105023 RepID=UPI003904AD20